MKATPAKKNIITPEPFENTDSANNTVSTISATLPNNCFPMHCIPPYRFKPAEPALSVNLFLPQKEYLTTSLKRHLDNSLNIKVVKKHFSNPMKEKGIRAALSEYHQVHNYTPAFIESFPDLYWGNSSGDVNGVFRGSAPNQIDKERVTKTNIMFFPKYERIQNETGIDRCRIYEIAKPIFEAGFGNESWCSSRGFSRRDIKVADDLITWMRYVGLYIYGYLIYSVAGDSYQRCIEGHLNRSDLEKEIGTETHGTPSINRFVLQASNEAV